MLTMFSASTFSLKLDQFLDWLPAAGVRIVIILAVAGVVLRLIRVLTERLSPLLTEIASRSAEGKKRAQTLVTVTRAFTSTVVGIVTAMLVLGEFGVHLAPLLAAAGIGGIAIGFGAQSLVRDLISGFFLLLEDQIRVGDVVKIGEKAGKVEHIGLRILTLRDFDGSLHIIPNGTITLVTNQTKGFAYAMVPVNVSHHANVDETMALLTQIGADFSRDPAFANDLLATVEVTGLEDFAAPRLRFTVRVKVVAGRQWQIARDLRRCIKAAFDAQGVKIL
ncbi:MAG: mechanosensitive ion channel [Deltaproteobacteria bacterium]|nr:mechanosensitive ion channel [Deltaproteobacteria bacterium]